MALALQVFGGLVVAAAVMQACVGLVSQINSAIRDRKMDRPCNLPPGHNQESLQAEIERLSALIGL